MIVYLMCRRDCELPCDMQQDCNTLCECWGSCGADSYCTCRACEALAPDAASDTQFFTIQNAAATSGAAQGNIIAGERQNSVLATTSVDGGVLARLQALCALWLNMLFRMQTLAQAVGPGAGCSRQQPM